MELLLHVVGHVIPCLQGYCDARGARTRVLLLSPPPKHEHNTQTEFRNVACWADNVALGLSSTAWIFSTSGSISSRSGSSSKL